MTAPDAPVLRARNVGTSAVRLTWLDVVGATGYDLFRGVASHDTGADGRNEKQTVTLDATGGTFTLTYAGQTTTALVFNVSAAAMEAALVALSNIALGDVAVTKVGAVYTVEFTGLLARTNVAQMTSDATLLTGGTHTATVATSVAGIGARTLDVTSPTFDAASSGTVYYYQVRAKNASGQGAASNEVRVLCSDSTPMGDETGALRINRTF